MGRAAESLILQGIKLAFTTASTFKRFSRIRILCGRKGVDGLVGRPKSAAQNIVTRLGKDGTNLDRILAPNRTRFDSTFSVAPADTLQRDSHD